MKANIPPFTVGQKVVYLKKVCANTNMNYPQKNAIVFLSNSKIYLDGSWIFQIAGFELDFDGCKQWFRSDEFAPIQEQTAPLLTFEKIKETEKEEILIMN